jgi:tRNA A-37 threonylcarbamoyl transferase component Bud32
MVVVAPKILNDELDIRRSWTNGEKADVHLVVTPQGEQQILKVYRPGFNGWMLREYLTLRLLSGRSVPIPKLLAFRFFRRELLMSLVPGDRLLEWGLREFGQPGLNLQEFENFEALYTDPRIVAAFQHLRESKELKAVKVKEAIKTSYRRLHALGWQHGTSDPRNIIYDGQTAYIIDFDHARPSLDPSKSDGPALLDWFGIGSSLSASVEDAGLPIEVKNRISD